MLDAGESPITSASATFERPLLLESVITSLAALLVGVFLARNRSTRACDDLTQQLAKAQERNKKRLSQMRSVKRAQALQRAGWEAVALRLKLDPLRTNLLLGLATLLVDMTVPEEAGESLRAKSNARALYPHEEGLAALVEGLNDRKLADWWKEGTYLSLHEMVMHLASTPDTRIPVEQARTEAQQDFEVAQFEALLAAQQQEDGAQNTW